MRHPTLSRRWFVHRVRIRHSRFIYERPSQCLQRLLGAVAGSPIGGAVIGGSKAKTAEGTCQDVRSDWISIHPEAEQFLAAMERLDQMRADRNDDVKLLARGTAQKWRGIFRGQIKTEIDLILRACGPGAVHFETLYPGGQCLRSMLIEGRGKAPGQIDPYEISSRHEPIEESRTVTISM